MLLNRDSCLQVKLDELKSLRLDSRLFLYTEEEDSVQMSIQLEEVYATNAHRGGPRFSNVIGSWSADSGMMVPFPNIWTRRSDLQGLRLRTTVNTYTIASRVVYGDDGDVVDAVGYFQEQNSFFRFGFP